MEGLEEPGAGLWVLGRVMLNEQIEIVISYRDGLTVWSAILIRGVASG